MTPKLPLRNTNKNNEDEDHEQLLADYIDPTEDNTYDATE